MLSLKINFNEVRQRVAASENLQEAGQDSDSKAMLLKLANDIIEKMDKNKQSLL